jgi:hypothetical protein
MTLSRLSEKCKYCPFVDTCDHKQMEMVGFLEPATRNNRQDIEEQLIVPHDYRQVKIAPNTTVTIDLEDFKNEINKSISKSAGLYGGYLKDCT